MVQQLARVQVTSRSWAKPAIPTPFIRGRTELSDWDVVMFATYMPLLLFYTNDYQDPSFMNTAILKSSLSETLVDFYPLAGRLIDVGNGIDAIDNNDEGVLFVEAEYPSDLKDFKKSGYLPSQMDYHRMFPIHFYSSPQDPLFAVQVTRFTDGGVALGLTVLHKVADMYSIAFFLDAWSKKARNTQYTPATFDRSLVAFPEDTVITDEVLEHYRSEHCSMKHKPLYPSNFESSLLKFARQGPKDLKPLKSIILEFHSSGLQACKKDAHTPEMIANKNWLSTKDALFAMLFRAIIRSRDVLEDDEMRMIMPMNGRSRMKNHKGMSYYFGNWMISRTFKTSLREVNETSLVSMATSLRQFVSSLQSSLFHGISKLYTLHEDMSANYLSYKPNSEHQTTVNDLSVLPFCKLDFSYGCPDRARGYITSGGNGCLIMIGRGDDADGAVYDVQLQMDVGSISRFIKDPDVVKYANKILY
ncbi:hypothetical protein CU097_012899 [Rhizopus azygosporus]|uniref:Transferase n=1 Tax=Rhizopus azygosporus TaxID=86630 RepID=A0A367JTF6_RHIAZ|nr:hypothetical protein CU097_012899 [Rhizopus azygosporus]